jgi:hypothetical protein
MLRWPNGFICAGCAARLAYQLAARPRFSNVPTAGGSIRRRDGLSPHPRAVAQMVCGKRGVSALFLARELALRYDTAWLMAHKLRHGWASDRNTRSTA